MKGLDWFRVMTDIAWDSDLEHVSDAEFRTYLELIAMSAYHLTDGVLMQRDCLKHLNTRRPGDTLRALSAHGYIILDAETITIPNYAKYQQTREEVESKRAASLDRVTRYRTRNTSVSNAPKSKSKSKSKKQPPTPLLVDPVEDIFNYWKRTFPRASAMTLTKDRRRAIHARLSEMSAATIFDAILAASKDPWWNGSQDGEWKADIKTICGKGSTVERLALKNIGAGPARVFSAEEEAEIEAALPVYRTGDIKDAMDLTSTDEIWLEVMRRARLG